MKFGDLGGRGRHPADPTGELFGDAHWPLPKYHEGFDMKIGINRENMTFVALGDYRAVWTKGMEVTTSEAFVIGPADEQRTYSKFTELELKLLYRNTTGFQHEGTNYNALLQSCKALGLKLEPIAGTPVPQPKPSSVPYAHPSKKPSPRVKEGAPQPPATRPKAGTATGRVWEVADEVLATMGTSDPKALRAEVLARCTTEGINPATVQVQFGKWRGSKNATTGA